MKLRLKENPREWQKFAWVMATVVSVVACVLAYRARVSPRVFGSILILMVGLAVWAVIWPRVFRWPYRIAMTASFHVGQFMGRVLLLIFFLFLVTPLGLLLRMAGMDLLHLRRGAQDQSYWRPAKPPGSFDRLF
jgi:hypothetical protein